MRILFITRCYPPVIGGLEKFSYDLSHHLANLAHLQSITNRKGKKNLPFFLPRALLQALFLITTGSIDIVCLSDALLAPLGVIIKSIYHLPVVSTVHGLDVTYHHKLYQSIIPACLKKLDRLVCVSNQTLAECQKRGIPAHRCTVIPNGINPNEFYLPGAGSREKLQAALKLDLAGKKILLSVGHLVARKGIPWFIQEVMPRLDKNTIYLIAGGYGNASKGNEKQVYSQIIKDLGLEKQVFLLGEVSPEILRLAYNSADLLVMPNIKVPGDMEGFGIVALEAASCGLPVLASNLEGIKDAVEDGKNGFLIEAYDAEGFVQKISDYQKRPKRQVREYTVTNFSWDKIALQHLTLFQEVCAQIKQRG